MTGLGAAVLLLVAGLRIAAAQGDLGRCSAAIDRGEFVPAAAQARAILRAQPDSIAARVLLARAYMGQNNGRAALGELHAALKRDPNAIDALYYVSKLAGILAQQEFAAVLQTAPDSARAHQLRAEALEARGDASGSEREYLVALGKRPETAYIMNALGDLNRHEKKYEAALGWYRKVLEKDPANYDALYGAGASYRALRAPADALPLFRRALRAEPSSAAAKMALGEVLLATGSAPEAVPLLEEAAAADPHIVRLQYMLGRAYEASGRTKEAQQAFARWREMAKNEPGEDQ